MKNLVCAVLALSVASCVTPPPKPAPQEATPATVEELAAAIAADGRRSDAASNAAIRGELAEEASRDAAACVALEPQAAACLYGRGVALGLEARAHPTRAGELLNLMLQSLAGAETADPTYDHAGPARVRALVLIRAPGWPLGPGDAGEGLAAARRAAALAPQYPPNLLALAEALAKSGDAEGARTNYELARDAAQPLSPSPDRDSWLHEAADGLQHH